MSKATKRKHVTKEIQEELRVPTEAETIVQIVGSRGNNLHEVIDCEGERYLVSMPVKFRRNIWVKSGNFVLVQAIPEGDKVKAEINNILTKEHIKFYRSQNVWPNNFDELAESIDSQRKISSDIEGELFVNTNRNCNSDLPSETSSSESD